VCYCCSVLQCVAVCCSVLQPGRHHVQLLFRHNAIDELQVCVIVAVCCSVLQCVAVSCSPGDIMCSCSFDIMPLTSYRCGFLLQCVAACCSELLF